MFRLWNAKIPGKSLGAITLLPLTIYRFRRGGIGNTLVLNSDVLNDLLMKGIVRSVWAFKCEDFS